MADMKAYLAARYMSGPKADAILARSQDPTIKKKRKKVVVKHEDYLGGGESSYKAEGSGSGLMLKDEDEWNGGEQDDEMDDTDGPIVTKVKKEFQKSKSTWSTVGATSLPVASRSALPSSTQDDETVKQESGTSTSTSAPAPAPAPAPLTKRRGGLRTAAQLREEAEQAAANRSPSPPPPDDHNQASGSGPGATVHRDASGRILDVEKLKADAKRVEEEERRKERERAEWSKGLVQRRAVQERAREEREMGQRDTARYANDAAMNRELREVERWNDPAAEFLTKKKKKGPRRPKYTGAWGPNRFSIPPGFRWDGVDRSTGFEKKYFQHQNSVARDTLEATKWGMEDM